MKLEHFITQLKQADIILYHAHDVISSPIRYFDNSSYNHCSIYDKDGYVFESIGNGVVRKKLGKSINDQNASFVVNMRPKEIELSASITQQIITTIENKYLGKAYGFSQLLLSGLMLKRWLDPNDYLKKLSFAFLTKATNDLMTFLDPSNKTLLCSELIYKAYNNIANKRNLDQMKIVMPIEDSILGSNFKKINSHKKRKKRKRVLNKRLSEAGVTEIFDAPKYFPSSSSELENQFNKYIAKEKLYLRNLNRPESRKLFIPRNDYNKAFFYKNKITLEDNAKYFRKKNPEFAKLLSHLNIENFITPGDISRSLNFEIISKHKSADKLNTSCHECKL